MPRTTILKNATVIDGTGAAARSGTSVVIRDAKIVAVGRDADVGVSSQSDATVVDLQGYTVIPGLIDAHAHLSYFPNPRGPMGLNYSVSLEENTIWALGNASTYLCRGFTTILDVGTRGRIAAAVRDAIDGGIVPGPRVVASGQVISTSGGLMNSYPEWLNVRGGNGAPVDGEDEIRREVRRQSLTGVDNIKLGVTGQLGTSARDWLLLSESEVAVAVDEARRRHLTVAAHAYGPEAVTAALEGGVDTLHHAFAGLTPETLELLHASSAYLVPTAMVFIDKAPPPSWPRASVDYFERHIDGYADALKQIAACELRHRVAVGSDSGISNPTASTAREIVLLENLGFTAVEAIRAATQTGARALRLDSEIGTIEEGKLADLCVVRGDLTEDLRRLEDADQIHLVIKSGKVVAREGLLA